ncbi:hypothetical protein DFP72DRAFT_1067403 [Ephemerocybe angulata]|uniref:Uncharacterized protein n=1 Tax=Ephemerocybe angulata TaxID=980116 RepID=A0A8H6M911_9AGAR|nr:hypothetical protein DFP72DRAFT_1067403 [Tulosesus angulatus]
MKATPCYLPRLRFLLLKAAVECCLQGGNILRLPPTFSSSVTVTFPYKSSLKVNDITAAAFAASLFVFADVELKESSSASTLEFLAHPSTHRFLVAPVNAPTLTRVVLPLDGRTPNLKVFQGIVKLLAKRREIKEVLPIRCLIGYVTQTFPDSVMVTWIKY